MFGDLRWLDFWGLSMIGILATGDRWLCGGLELVGSWVVQDSWVCDG